MALHLAMHCCFYFLLSMLVEVTSNSQFKPAITDCSVESIGYKHMVTLNWTLLNENYYLGIREYWIYCNCSDYETDFTKNKVNGLCEHCSHSFDLPLETCIDKCSCQVYGHPRWGYAYNQDYWSDSCNFSIGPLAPRVAPDIFEPVTKMNKQRSVHVLFELSRPLQKLYCDTDIVKSVSVYVTQESGDTYQFLIGGNDIRKINDTYEFTLQFKDHQKYDFWRAAHLSISVHNSKDASPFSSPYTIRGAVNSDIEPGSYTLRYENITNSSASFFWLLNKPLPNMVEWGFISGSQYNLSLFDGTSIKNNSTEDITFTLSDLSPGQKYLICVTLITADTDSWPPWPSCKNFMTKQGLSDDSVAGYGGNNTTNILWFLFIAVFALFIVVLIISVLCLKPYCSKKSDRVRTPERNSVSEEITQLSSHVTTIPILGPDDSVIESLSNIATSNEDGTSLQGEYVQIKDVSSDTYSVT